MRYVFVPCNVNGLGLQPSTRITLEESCSSFGMNSSAPVLSAILVLRSLYILTTLNWINKPVVLLLLTNVAAVVCCHGICYYNTLKRGFQARLLLSLLVAIDVKQSLWFDQLQVVLWKWLSLKVNSLAFIIKIVCLLFRQCLAFILRWVNSSAINSWVNNSCPSHKYSSKNILGI